MGKVERPLTANEVTFCYEYVANKFNGTRAYLATFKQTNNENTAAAEASKLLRKPKVEEKVKELTEKHLKSISIRSDDIIKELAIVGFSDIKNYIDFAGDVVQMKSSDAIGKFSKAISSIKITPKYIRGEGGKSIEASQVEFKLYDKIKALELLGKNQLLFSENKANNDQDININITYDD